MTLRLSEVYESIQGEGPRTGMRTTFIRFAGCNLRCPGWPCDTQHAIDPAIWRHESYKLVPEVVARDVTSPNVCLTGGEPFMQNSEDLSSLVSLLLQSDHLVEVFTNGTYEIEPYMLTCGLRFNLDWKLPGSGEIIVGAQGKNRLRNAKALTPFDSIKFVCNNMDDLYAAFNAYCDLREAGCQAEFWVGRVWSSKLTYDDLLTFVAEMNLPWRFNVQVHNYIFNPQERRR